MVQPKLRFFADESADFADESANGIADGMRKGSLDSGKNSVVPPSDDVAKGAANSTELI